MYSRYSGPMTTGIGCVSRKASRSSGESFAKRLRLTSTSSMPTVSWVGKSDLMDARLIFDMVDGAVFVYFAASISFARAGFRGPGSRSRYPGALRLRHGVRPRHPALPALLREA